MSSQRGLTVLGPSVRKVPDPLRMLHVPIPLCTARTRMCDRPSHLPTVYIVLNRFACMGGNGVQNNIGYGFYIYKLLNLELNLFVYLNSKLV